MPQANKAHIFVPLMKVDAATGMVYGRITQEVVDKSGEIMDYDKSKPYFKAWSAEIEKATGGKSLGNVRVMHQPKAAGKLTLMDFLDDDKAIDVAAKIVDREELKKCEEGVYTGFSIGGNYVDKWTDPDDSSVTRFVVNPVEVSIVDNPCVPSAHFTLKGEDGTEVQKAFQIWAPSNDDVLKAAQDLATAKGDGASYIDFLVQARDDLVKAHAKAGDEEEGEDGKEAAAAPEAEGKPDGAAPGATSGEQANEEKPEDGKKAAGGDYSPTNAEVLAEAERMAKEAGTPDKRSNFVAKARDALIAKGGSTSTTETVEEPAPAVEEPKPDASKGAAAQLVVEQVWKTADGETFAKKDDAAKHAAELVAKGAGAADRDPLNALLDKAEGKKPKGDYGDVEYADPGYQSDGKPRYPVDTEEHIRAAWSYINKAKNAKAYSSEDLDKIKAKIVAAWKSKIDKEGPPSADKMAAVLANPGAAIKAVLAIREKGAEVRKGLYTVRDVAAVLERMGWIFTSVVYEENAEGDSDSKLPQQARDLLAAMQTFLVEMVQEEVGEQIASVLANNTAIEIIVPDADAEILECAVGLIDCVKIDTALVEKAGARNSKADLAKLQTMHDHAVALGAKCDGAGEKAAGADLAKLEEAPAFKAVQAENERLTKAMAEALPRMEKMLGELADARERIVKLEAIPMPSAPKTNVIGRDGKAVGSSQAGDAGTMAAAILKEIPAEQLALAAIKVSHQQGVPIMARGNGGAG